jgi:hypothetical protein
MSGNRKGRPRTVKTRLETPEDFDEVMLQVANRKVPGDPGRGVEGMNLYSYNVNILATGKVANRIATTAFIDMVHDAAGRKKRRKDAEAREEERRRHVAMMLDKPGF